MMQNSDAAKSPRATTHPKPTAIDLFCGAGGLSLGLQAAGFDILLAADFWPVAVDTYRRNFSHPLVCADLGTCSASDIFSKANIPPRPVDLVVGGPPCQGFSVQRIGPDADHRNNLVLRFAKLVAELSPRYFIMENVPGLAGKRGSSQLDAFMDAVAASGFEAEAKLVNAADYGVPQIRKRIIVLGWHRHLARPISFPPPTHALANYLTVWDAIGDLPSPALPGERTPPDPLHKATRLSDLNRERLKYIPPGGGMQDLPVHMRVNCHKAGADKIGHRYVYGRLDATRSSSTITARFDSFTRGRFAHPRQDRNITLREGARLQTFPDSFLFAGNQEEIAAQIGNAVPPRLAQAFGTAVRDAGPDNATQGPTRHPTRKALPSTYRRNQLFLTLRETTK